MDTSSARRTSKTNKPGGKTGLKVADRGDKTPIEPFIHAISDLPQHIIAVIQRLHEALINRNHLKVPIQR
jgi:hypothetical protein